MPPRTLVYTQAHNVRDFWEVHQLGETSFPFILVWAQTEPRPVHFPPVQCFTISKSSQLSSVSQLRHSHRIGLLHLRIALMQSQDCANVLCNLKIGTDSENVQCNLEIAQIPRLHEHIYRSLTKKGPWAQYLTLSPDKGVSGYL